jgi:hypothetical protein
VTDNCAASPSLTYTDSALSPATIPNIAAADLNQVFTRTWTVSDRCSNTNTCSQSITKQGVMTEFTVKGTFNGAVSSGTSSLFELYLGADGFDSGAAPIATGNTAGDADGVIISTFLNPSLTYTICQRSTPAGWSFNWVMNGATVTPYNPNADDIPAESFGHYCFDFQPTTCNGVFRFEIDNSFTPGGCPRTPGYWKVSMRIAVELVSSPPSELP